jgi:hypothetical protein
MWRREAGAGYRGFYGFGVRRCLPCTPRPFEHWHARCHMCPTFRNRR